VTNERDELKQSKHEADEKLETLTVQVQSLTSQTSSLQAQCKTQVASIKEKEACIKSLEDRVKSKAFAIARYEEEMIATSKEISYLKSKCQELEALSSNAKSDVLSELLSDKADLESKLQSLRLQEQSLALELSTINEEKIALAKSSLDMAEAYEEKIKSLQADAKRADELTVELEQQRCMYEQAQLAVKSLQQALVVSSECPRIYYHVNLWPSAKHSPFLLRLKMYRLWRNTGRSFSANLHAESKVIGLVNMLPECINVSIPLRSEGR
jgi:chromosome segregation ATPase